MTSPTTDVPDHLEQVEQMLAHFEKIEAQFEQVREGLTHSHRLTTLGTIASMVAHEYNNILTPMLSYCQLALMSPDDDQLMRKAVEKALAAGQRAARISSSMLDFSRDGTDADETADLRQTVDDVFACLARDPARDGIELVISVPDVMVTMPPVQLQQVLVNLVLNAMQAMRLTKGAGRLTIHGELDNETLQLNVADTGPGIPVAIADRLFEPFVSQRPQAPLRLVVDDDEQDAANKDEQGEGTGLGLCICRDLIIQAGGSINVSSDPGRGATFHIQLPVADILNCKDGEKSTMPFKGDSFGDDQTEEINARTRSFQERPMCRSLDACAPIVHQSTVKYVL